MKREQKAVTTKTARRYAYHSPDISLTGVDLEGIICVASEIKFDAVIEDYNTGDNEIPDDEPDYFGS